MTPKQKRPEPKNKITGVRLEPDLRAALEKTAVEMNEENPFAEVTPAGIIRGLVKNFLAEREKLKSKKGT